ncbi:hypothetical protein CMV_028006 [Castanea mollissima]|uniref:Uncharacterized protein n=1 Tax=Castanea mollissima TaxID=60419 RepID=A0A8J4QEG7_9ROSI|nr:hypothetical protein CMV_028006 [Castanea mollissima]
MPKTPYSSGQEVVNGREALIVCFTAQPLARISGSDDTGLFLIGKSLKFPLVQSPNFKNFLSSTKPCCTWDTSVDSR